MTTTVDELPEVEIPDVLTEQAKRLRETLEEPLYDEEAHRRREVALDKLDKRVPPTPYIVVFVVHHQRDPTFAGPMTSKGVPFIPGQVVGRAFLVEHESARVTCAADVIARNNEDVLTADGDDIRGAAADSVARDLRVEVQRTIAKAMKEAGPARVRFTDLE